MIAGARKRGGGAVRPLTASETRAIAALQQRWPKAEPWTWSVTRSRARDGQSLRLSIASMAALEQIWKPSERYTGITFHVTSDRHWYPAMRIQYTDGPAREEVEVIAREYVGYVDDSRPLDEGPHYVPLPGKGGQISKATRLARRILP